LDTDGLTTWHHYGDEHSDPAHWLRDKHMLPGYIPEARILTYDWNANYDKEASVATLKDQGARLLDMISADRRQKVHSLGIHTSYPVLMRLTT